MFESMESTQMANLVVCWPDAVVAEPPDDDVVWDVWEEVDLVLVLGGVVVVIGAIPPLPLPPGLVVTGAFAPPPLVGLVVIGAFAGAIAFLTPE